MAGRLTISTLNDDTGVLATQNGMSGIAKAWVNCGYSGGTMVTRASMNVSSVTRNGTGNYTLNFTTAMADSNYVPVFSTYGQNTLRMMCVLTATSDTGSPTLKNTTQMQYITGSTASGGLFDQAEQYIAIFR
jgi:hypothetical protein